LPQLINVIKGDMSLVGPRPQVSAHFELFSDDAKKVYSRVRPGVTGMASIIFRDEESMLSKSDKLNKDFYKDVITPLKCEIIKWYVKNASLWLDVKIIFATVGCLFFPKSKFYLSWFKGLPNLDVLSE
jgi:lipopolysaccharide/colanic/teichoic acid biosynthesis glycosyltransferase